MIALRLGDGSSPPQFYVPASIEPGVWQLTPGCPPAGGVNFQWQNMTFNQITDDISDARVYGGIHFRFDQDAGADLGRDLATYVYTHNLRRAKHSDNDDEGGN
jgi:hypothetical protein